MRIRFEGMLVLHTNFDNVSKVLAPGTGYDKVLLSTFKAV